LDRISEPYVNAGSSLLDGVVALVALASETFAGSAEAERQNDTSS
jgi:hypothetical protein